MPSSCNFNLIAPFELLANIPAVVIMQIRLESQKHIENACFGLDVIRSEHGKRAAAI